MVTGQAWQGRRNVYRGGGYKSRRAKQFFCCTPKYHFAPSNRGYKIIAKITRRLVQKCTTWFRSTISPVVAHRTIVL